MRERYCPAVDLLFVVECVCGQYLASAPSVPRGFKLQKFRPAFGKSHRGTLGGGGSQPNPPPPRQTLPPLLILPPARFPCLTRPPVPVALSDAQSTASGPTTPTRASARRCSSRTAPSATWRARSCWGAPPRGRSTSSSAASTTTGPRGATCGSPRAATSTTPTPSPPRTRRGGPFACQVPCVSARGFFRGRVVFFELKNVVLA